MLPQNFSETHRCKKMFMFVLPCFTVKEKVACPRKSCCLVKTLNYFSQTYAKTIRIRGSSSVISLSCLLFIYNQSSEIFIAIISKKMRIIVLKKIGIFSNFSIMYGFTWFQLSCVPHVQKQLLEMHTLLIATRANCLVMQPTANRISDEMIEQMTQCF